MAERILIYRMGSLGDTVVALPVFHMLSREFPDAERRVLTNVPINSDAAAIQAVLGDGGFVDGYFPYPIGTRSIKRLNELRRSVRDWNPDLVVYLNEPRRGANLYRDLAFLYLCGARNIVGAPLSGTLRRHKKLPEHGLWENESSRLARCVAELGEIRLDDADDWSLNATLAEKAGAQKALTGWAGEKKFISFAIGAKIAFKSWGDDRWEALFEALGKRYPDVGLALLGGPNDGERAARAATQWPGPVLDLCGKLTPRESAMVVGNGLIFLGHDSGPMHLAASTGTPSICVFSTHANPGVWFPFGAQHRVFYPGLPWSGGIPTETREANNEANITLIPVAQVLEASDTLLARAITRKQAQHDPGNA